MKAHFSFVVWLLALCTKLEGATDLTLGSVLGLSGTQVSIPISLSTDRSIVGLQLDVAFDSLRLTADSVSKGGGLSDGHVVRSGELSPGNLRVLIYSDENLGIPNGEVLSLVFGIASGAPLGPVAVNLTGVLLADPTATAVAADNLGAGSVVVADAIPAVVQNRLLFYNNSSFDVANDAAAIASDKTALLPGGVATFSNYSSYSRGLNGVMIDISDLASASNIGVDDFNFRVGNSNDLSSWTAAPPPSSILIETGSGTNGSDRVILEWLDNMIEKQWLEVTVLANADTGLTVEDRFYFGSAIGDTGNSAANTQVDISDENLARGNPRNFLDPAPIDFDFDFNRDQRVDISDQNIARGNGSNFLNALKLIDLSQQSLALTSRSSFDRRFGVDGEINESQSEFSRLSHPLKTVQLQIRRETDGGLVLEAAESGGLSVVLQSSFSGPNGPWVNVEAGRIGGDLDRSSDYAWLINPEESFVLYRLIQQADESKLEVIAE